MGKVSFLPETIINRIAAGEVVESPGSVVKELIENSIDADATDIGIEVRSGGKKFISVRDDGSGIEPDDIEKIFKRHATSKIRGPEDLYRIKSLGFRGEALYSISSVADVVLQSSASDTGEGKEVHIRGGVFIGIRDIPRNRGTTVEVRELFFNTPARKKFLKTDTVEFRRIISIVTPYTISFPDIKFSLVHNEKVISNLSPAKDTYERFCEVTGIKKEYTVCAEREIGEKRILLKVLLGDINLQFPVRSRQYIFINSRPVYHRGISSAVNGVYEDIFPKDLYPAFAVFIQLPWDDVDVNVHPAKREVKLKEEGYIISVLTDLCRETLLKCLRGKEITYRESYYESSDHVKETEELPSVSEDRTCQELFSKEYIGKEVRKDDLRTKLKNAFYAGCYKNKYLFFDAGDVLLVLDQHAAHERIKFEMLKKQWEIGKIEIQRVLTPLIVKLNSEEMVYWEEGKELLEDIGFLTTRWDTHSIAIHGFPRVIKNPEVSIRNILAEKNFMQYDKETLAKKACKDAVSAGERITEEEALQIKNDLLKCEVLFVCPHGRPTVIEFSEQFFDRQFLR